LVAEAEIDSAGNLQMHEQPSDPRFYRLNSGWYWEIKNPSGTLEKSPSLGEETLDLSGLNFEENHDVQTIYGPGQQALRAHIMHVSYPRANTSITFVTTAPVMQITDDVRDFSMHIIISFFMLGIGLSLAVVLQVRLALKPLKAIKTAIGDVQIGKSKRLPQEFPSDVQPLVEELNHLLDHNEVLLKRARNQLGDLAHAVKNPLTVIRNEARSMANEQGQIILDQSHAMASSIDHFLSQARIYGKKDVIGYRTSVKAVINDLTYAVKHIYRDRGIEIQFSDQGACQFRGESQDLEEMAGNLIDNACKWAKSKIVINCKTANSRLLLIVEDDGPGIPKEKLGDVIQRGCKLDDSKPGHGQGLGIVNDIADLYGGRLKLSQSSLGGLQAELDLPAA
jgi:signal transduction histidine kinase